MRLRVNFKENNTRVKVNFKEAYKVSDGGYERGFAEGEKVGYSNGYTEGETKGKEQGYTEGKQAEYDAFWDAYQQNGERRFYTYGFANPGWTNETFKPKYDMIVGGGLNYQMFDRSLIEGSLTEILNELGIALYFEGGYSSGTFMGSNFTEIDISSSLPFNLWASTFNNCSKLKTLKLPEFYKQVGFNTTAFNCPVLENLTLSGVIGTSINFQYSPLTPESMKNVISCLNNYSGTDNEYVNKVTFTEECWAALEADSTSPTGTTWADYVNSLGWIT